MFSWEDKSFLQIVLHSAILAAVLLGSFGILIGLLSPPTSADGPSNADLLPFQLILPFFGFGFGAIAGWGVALHYSSKNFVTKLGFLCAGGVITSSIMFLSLFLGDLLANIISPTEYVTEPIPFWHAAEPIFLTIIAISYPVIAITWFLHPVNRAMRNFFW